MLVVLTVKQAALCSPGIDKFVVRDSSSQLRVSGAGPFQGLSRGALHRTHAVQPLTMT